MIWHDTIQYNGDILRNATESLKYEKSSIFNEILKASHRKSHFQELLHISGTIKVKVNVQTFNKLCYRIFVRVGLLLNNFDWIFNTCFCFGPSLFVMTAEVK